MTVQLSFLTPVYRPNLAHFKACARSVIDQTASNWEWVIVDDGSNQPELTAYLTELNEDPRIHVVTREQNGGIVAASNDGLHRTHGTLVALLDQDDVLVRQAAERVLETLTANPDATIIYSDRGHIDADGQPTGRDFLKPQWSPIRLAGNMYIAHLTVLNRDCALTVGGFRSEFEGSQDHDLVLRISELPGRVIHIPEVLYYWRMTADSTAANADAKPYARTAGVRAVQAHLDRTGQVGIASESWAPGFYRITRTPPTAMASIVVPTMGSHARVWDRDRCLVTEAVASICAQQYEVEYEIVVVYDDRDGLDLAYLDDLRAIAGDRLRLTRFDRPFNFSEKINTGVLASAGDVIVILNDDVQVKTPTWLDDLVALAMLPGVGAVGAKLILEDGRIQHSALQVAPPADIHNADFGHDPSYGGYYGSLVVDHEVVGVTGACLAVRRSTFLEVGGFPEQLESSFNDVDFCFRLLDHGYRNVAAMGVELFHFESLSRDPTVNLDDFVKLRAFWLHRLSVDPYLRGRSKPIFAMD